MLHGIHLHCTHTTPNTQYCTYTFYMYLISVKGLQFTYHAHKHCPNGNSILMQNDRMVEYGADMYIIIIVHTIYVHTTYVHMYIHTVLPMHT